jgi:hypothetical protein
VKNKQKSKNPNNQKTITGHKIPVAVSSRLQTALERFWFDNLSLLIPPNQDII